jgi:magnesium-transporting ATPase (P-type)
VIPWIAAALAFLGERFDRGQGMAPVGIAIVIVILVSGAFSFSQDHRVDRALAALEKLLPQRVQALRDGAVAQVAAERIVPGHVILLEQGSLITADGRLLESSRLRVNGAPLTRESAPQGRDPAPCPDDDLRRSRNVVLAGTSVLSGRGKAVVFATGAYTAFGKVARLTEASGKALSPLRRELAHLSRRRRWARRPRSVPTRPAP